MRIKEVIKRVREAKLFHFKIRYNKNHLLKTHPKSIKDIDKALRANKLIYL